MTSIKLLLFGATKDIVGQSEIQLNLNENATVAHLKARLQAAHPKLGTLNYLAVAVNEEYAKDDQLIGEKDVVALIPPVSGG